MRRRRLLAVVVAASLALVACSSDDGEPTASAPGPTTTAAPAGPQPSPGCDGAAAVEPGTSEHVMTTGDEERAYQLLVPAGYDGSTPYPLVLGLHSLTVPHTFVAPGAGFAEAQQQFDFIAAMPSGRTDPTPYWVAAPAEPNHDVTFISELLDRLGADLCLDTSRVLSTGLSNGGHMSSLLACRLSDRITAVAPIAGAEFPAEGCDGEPVPVMAFHGAEDAVVPYAGGGLDGATIADQNLWRGDRPEGLPLHRGVDDAMANWAANNGCDPEPTEERVSPEVIRRTWSGCEAETVLYVVENGGHNWPGHPVPGFQEQFGHTTTDIDATALMLEFFLGPEG
ncbi:MAG TPA: hypothetical protein VD926_12875 [Acidimicrobiales bacterium]|nr:hypothetical protein [Acidimicrobiales bacterium]